MSSSSLAAGAGAAEAGGRLLPIWLVKEYYWCPVSAYLRLVGWAERPTASMLLGSESVPRGRIVELLEERHRLRELLWEHPVASRRLGLQGRADLVALTVDGGLVVVEAKLPRLSRRRLWGRDRRLAVQLAAYAVAAEETLGAPLEAAYLYSVEGDRLVEVRVSPRLRRLVEHAARELHGMLERGEPPGRANVPRWRCRLCSYRGVCPHGRG